MGMAEPVTASPLLRQRGICRPRKLAEITNIENLQKASTSFICFMASGFREVQADDTSEQAIIQHNANMLYCYSGWLLYSNDETDCIVVCARRQPGVSNTTFLF